MKNKNLYVAALDSELHNCESIGKICDLFGGVEQGLKWIRQEHTEKEIIDVLRKLGFEIAPDITGSTKRKFLCNAGL